MDTNIYNKNLANAKPNYERKEDIFQTQKAKMTSLKATQKSKLFGGKKSNTPDEIGLNQVLKHKFKKIMIEYLLINFDFQRKNLSNI